MVRSRGFTLIEVLSVISILAILGAGTITALRAIKRSSMRQQAAVEAAEIAQAVLQYRSAYGQWPNEDDVRTDDSTAIVAAVSDLDDPAGGVKKTDLNLEDIMSTLDPESESNPRSITFLELPDRCFKIMDDDGKYQKSTVPHDPWGRPYVVVMASSKRNSGKKSRTVSHVEGGVYAANIQTKNDSFTVDSPEDIVVFSWGDPLMRTNGTSRVIGSWRIE